MQFCHGTRERAASTASWLQFLLLDDEAVVVLGRRLFLKQFSEAGPQLGENPAGGTPAPTGWAAVL